MWPYHADLLQRAVPRYTSYPPATAFSDDVSADEQAEAINRIEAGAPVSLYVHIPYCQSICWYCGCNTGVAGRAHRLTAYLEALEVEMALVARLLGGRGRVGRIEFGGGSPNAIDPLAFVRLVDRLSTMFAASVPDISVEIDPRAFSPSWAATLAASMVSRVSMGIQTFSPELQAAIGRHQPVELIEMCVESLRARGIGQINFDLLYGLPGQTIALLESTLDVVARLRPTRVALFGYAHVPSMFPRQKRIDVSRLPDLRERFDQAARGFERLTAEGYIPVGFDHFALPDDPLGRAALAGRVRRSFQGFTEDQSSAMLGLGASAISQFPDRIVQNEKAPGRYRDLMAGRRLAATRGVLRSESDMAAGRVIEALLCSLRAKPGSALLAGQQGAALAPFLDRGLARLEGETLVITASGRPYARAIAALFDHRLVHSGITGSAERRPAVSAI